MIRRGRQQGWLKRPIAEFRPWAEFNGVKFDGIRIGPLPGFEERGSTVIAERDFTGGNEPPLVVVPRGLILSLEGVEVSAKADQNLKELLKCLGSFGRTARGAILLFLLFQASISCPDIPESIGVPCPLTEYIKFLPEELLPTFWTEDEHEILLGTTLKPAINAKLNSLLREFEDVRTATENIAWCKKYWWDEDDGLITFEDWIQVDAMYRSRALEYPGIGDCMVPCVDMANHSSGDATAALYEKDEDGNGVLVLRDGKIIKKDEEVTITYGDEKGACEMLFSYGFIEDSMDSAKVMFIDLTIPEDDPLRMAKLSVSTAAPGFRLFDRGDGTGWESDFVWLIVVNEEDGLGINVLQTIDGKYEMKSRWKEEELVDTAQLRELLVKEELWDVYQLRAVAILQARVEVQMRMLYGVGTPERDDHIRQTPWKLARKLRELELALLEKLYGDLEDQKLVLVQSQVVRKYLGMDEDDAEDEDFT